MNIIFYKNSGIIYSLIVIFLVIEIPLFLIAFTANIIILNLFLTLFTLFWIIGIYVFRKNLFKKIIIDNKSVKCIYSDTIYNDIPWDEIYLIKKTNENRNQGIILYYNSNKKLLININRRKLKIIIEICPNVTLKSQMEKIKFIF